VPKKPSKTQPAKTPQPEPAQVKAVERLLRDGEYQRAIERARVMVQRFPDHGGANHLLLQALERGESRGAAALAAEAAGARPYNSVPPAALRIAKAAAEVVEEKGLTGLTHRAVATRAGVTTGSVTHHFRSIEDLVAGAIRGQVQLMTEQVRAQSNPPPSVDEIQTVEQYFEALRHHVASGAPPSPVLRRRRLFLAAVRREDLAASGAVIRFSQGGTTRDTLERIFSLPESDLVLHASVVSRLLSAIWFACAGDAEPARARTAVFDRIETRLRARLTPPEAEGAGGG